MPGQFHPRGVTMRDYWNGRAGFDRVLMAVAATFLTVSATAAFAQGDAPRSTAADLAIDAAIPRPEPANVPPPTASDFKMDTTATVPDPAKTTEKALETKPAETRRGSRTTSRKTTPRRRRRPRPQPLPPNPPRNRSRPPAMSPPADQPVADKLKEMLGAKSSKYFDRKAERAAVEKFYTAREYAPLWTQGRRAHRERQGRRCAPQGRRRRRPQCRRLSGAGFRRGDFAGCAGRRRTEAHRQHAGLCAPGPERPDALVAGQRRHPVSGSSDRSGRSACQRHHRQGRQRGAGGLQPAAQALSRTEEEARRIARPGRRPGDADRRRPGAEIHPGARQEAAGDRGGRSARAATARQARHHRECRRHPLRRQGRRSGAQVPGRRRPQGHRRARRSHGQGDQQPEARPRDRHRDRQHGALALAAAPARRAVDRQRLRHSQHSRLHAEGDAERRAGLDHQGGDRQAGHRTRPRC